MEEIEIEETEIQSEAVRDFLEQIPSWIIRWGIVVISFVIIGSFSISYFVKYPDIVSTPFKLTTLDAPKTIVAKGDGKLVSLFVKDKAQVEKGQVLAFLEATASHDEVLQLERNLENESLDLQNLGELQASYQTFNQAQIQYFSFQKYGFLTKRKVLLAKDLNDLKQLSQNISAQKEIQIEDFKLAENEYYTQKKLLDQKVIAPLEFKREESKYINKKLPIKNLESAQISNATAQTAKKKEIMDMDKTISEQENIYLQAKNTMKSAIEAWKQRYILTANMAGQISFSGIIEEKMQVLANQQLFFISNPNQNYYGAILIPQDNFGKVKIGQKVIIKLNSYPFQEFGMIEGKIQSIAEQPTNLNNLEYYMARVNFTNGLNTNFNKKINYREGMIGTSEIITEDLRLIERLFYQIRKAFTR
jgi:multidrug resistance efflux pump